MNITQTENLIRKIDEKLVENDALRSNMESVNPNISTPEVTGILKLVKTLVDGAQKDLHEIRDELIKTL